MLNRVLHELNDVVSIPHEDGVLLKLCFDVVLYMETLSEREQRQAVLSVFDEYCGLYQKQFGANREYAPG